VTSAPPEQTLARLTVPANLASLSAVLGLVRDLASGQGLDARAVERLAFVAEEAAANVIAGAYPPGEPGSLDLIVTRRPHQLVVAVEDQGLPFDFRTFEKEESSLTELLARSFGGTVRCCSLGRRGNRVELTCELTADRPLAHVAAAEIARAEEPAIAADVPLTFRMMQPADAESVVRCVYRGYGYTYPNEFMYDPSQLLHLQAAGLFHSAVAVSEAGEVAGHVGLMLERPGASVGETGQAVVDPRYRGHHIFERVKAVLEEHARGLGMAGTYAEAVALHPFSQKGSLATGAHETGIELAADPPSVSYRKIVESQLQRDSLVLMYVKLNETPPRDIYAPVSHEAILRRIYDVNSLSRRFQPLPSEAALPPHAQLDVKVDTAWNEALIQVHTAGQDLPTQVGFRQRELVRRGIGWMALELPLGNAEAMRFAPALEGMGFFFAGIVPEIIDGDVLRLQFLNEARFDPAQIHVASDFGRELLDYVLAAHRSAGVP